jgi:hypothetical protein
MLKYQVDRNVLINIYCDVSHEFHSLCYWIHFCSILVLDVVMSLNIVAFYKTTLVSSFHFDFSAHAQYNMCMITFKREWLYYLCL